MIVMKQESKVKARRPLPNGWRWGRLSEVCDAVRGVTFQSSEATTVPFERSIACLTTSAVQSEVNWESRCFIPYDRVTRQDQLLRPGDLLVSTANSKALVGKSCFVPETPFLSTFGAFVTILRPKSTIEPLFLANWMRSPDALDYCFLMSSNTTNISNLRVSDLLALEIPLPPPTEQKRIAAKLSEQMATVERARAAVEIQLEAANVLPNAYLRGLFESLEAQQWPRKQLGNIASVSGGIQKTPSRTPSSFHRPFLTVRNVQRGRLDLSDIERFEVTLIELARYRLEAGDILIVEGNGSPDHIGRNAIFSGEIEDCIHQNHIIRVRLNKSQNDPEFVSSYLNSDHGKIQMLEKAKTTTGLYTLSVSKVEQLEVATPSLAEQQRIAAMLSEQMIKVERISIALEEQLAAINALPSALLRRAFSGEL